MLGIMGGVPKQVDKGLRHAAVVALGELGRSHDYRDRADAGHGLAGFADMSEAFGLLLELVLDPRDTFVTRRTTQALLRRKDRIGLTIVASALAVANPNHSDWIHTAVVDVLSIFSADRDDAMRLCEEMSQGADDRVARGARQLLELLAEIDPVLRPA
ncbi:hypothetical protein ACIBG6_36800 [Streptomyces sp. NPDC050842]|uniref:hypothetical protein n=1 Tax=Streptomyces sp. NPDC050842 TaxID=3365636 RepID=UPI0037A8DE4F